MSVMFQMPVWTVEAFKRGTLSMLNHLEFLGFRLSFVVANILTSMVIAAVFELSLRHHHPFLEVLGGSIGSVSFEGKA